MVSISRVSPVTLPATPVKTEERDGWTVVLEYEAEGPGPHLIDLSHRSKWDVQGVDLSNSSPWEIKYPEKPGTCVYDKGILINRIEPRHLSGIYPVFFKTRRKTMRLPKLPMPSHAWRLQEKGCS